MRGSTAGLLVSAVFAMRCGANGAPEGARSSPHEWPTPGVAESLLASPQPNPAAVSLLELIARPNDYDGKPITVIGFAHLEFEGQGLYLHREDYEHVLGTNAVWVDVDLKPEFKALNGRYIIVQGVFEAKHMGHSGMFRGAIRQVSRYDPWPTRADLERQR